jgi:hypothetical protein
MRENVILSDSEESIPSRSKNSRFGAKILSFDQPDMDSSFRFAPFRMTYHLLFNHYPNELN